MGTKQPRILFTIPNFDTAGSGKALLNIADGLREFGFDTMICCMNDNGPLFLKIKELGLPCHLFPYAVDMSNRFQGLAGVWRTSRFFRELAPDLIHSFHYSSDYSEVLAARLANVKWIYTKKSMSWGGTSKNSWWLRSTLAHGVIAQNTDMMTLFFKDSTKTKLIPRGVNTSEFSPVNGDKRQLILEKLNLSPSNRFIVTVANLVPVKGIEILMNSFFTIRNRFSDVRLIIVGDNQSDYGKMLAQKAKEIANDHIIFTGKVSNVSDYLQVCTIFVLPTLNEGRQEGSPVSLLEAMATAKPVLASNVAGIRDQLVKFPDALFTPGEPKELASKLSYLLEQSDSYLEQKGNGFRQEVLERYTLIQEVDSHAQFYRSLLKGRND